MATGGLQIPEVPANCKSQLIQVFFSTIRLFPLFTLFSPSLAAPTSTGPTEARPTRGVSSGMGERALKRVGRV